MFINPLWRIVYRKGLDFSIVPVTLNRTVPFFLLQLGQGPTPISFLDGCTTEAKQFFMAVCEEKCYSLAGTRKRKIHLRRQCTAVRESEAEKPPGFAVVVVQECSTTLQRTNVEDTTIPRNKAYAWSALLPSPALKLFAKTKFRLPVVARENALRL